MSKFIWILDAGHGGLRNGYYTTCPAKMHTFPDGFEICEGVINREIARRVWVQLAEHKVEFALVYDEVEDDPLSIRVERANNIYRKGKNAIFLSIHCNAGGGHGFEVFTSPGKTLSDDIARFFCKGYQKKFPERRLRADLQDGDPDKEAKFYVLVHTMCPAVLLENLFFDNREEAEYLASEEGQQAIADCIVNSILEIEQTFNL